MDPDDIYYGLTAAQAADGTDLERAVAELADAVAEIEHQAAEATAGDDIVDAAVLLDAIEPARTALLAVQFDLRAHIYRKAGRGVHDAGHAPVKVNREAGDKRWQSEQLFDHLVSRSRVNADGEKVPAEEALLALVQSLKAALPLNPSLEWRSKALSELGVQTDEWFERPRPGRVKVERLPARPDAEGAGQ